MTAKKAIAPGAGPAVEVARAPGRRRLRWLLGGVLVIAAACGGIFALWPRVRDHVFAGSDYQLRASDITITPPPPWIRTDIKAQVIHDASLDAYLSIVADDLTVRVAQAFKLQPWVADVRRVSKSYPAHLDVELVYRTPVAMVDVESGLFPIDADAVLLPSDDFTSDDIPQYLRLSGIETNPSGPVGTRWGDLNVAGGAQIAACLASDRLALKLNRIVAPTRSAQNPFNDGYTYELLTDAGTRIVWGRPPGDEPAGEMSAAEKVAQLNEYVAQHGSLDGPDGPQQIDLRGGEYLIVTPRTAIKPLPIEEPSR